MTISWERAAPLAFRYCCFSLFFPISVVGVRLVSRAGCGTRLYRFLIIAFASTLDPVFPKDLFFSDYLHVLSNYKKKVDRHYLESPMDQIFLFEIKELKCKDNRKLNHFFTNFDLRMYFEISGFEIARGNCNSNFNGEVKFSENITVNGKCRRKNWVK